MRACKYAYLLVCISALLSCIPGEPLDKIVSPGQQVGGKWIVTGIISADTIEMSAVSQERYMLVARLLHIETPQRGEWKYLQAKQALDRLVAGKEFYISYDDSNNKEEDKEGRLLVHVYNEKIDINVEMVRLGWAHLSSDCSLTSSSKELICAQDEAKSAKRGLWSEEARNAH